MDTIKMLEPCKECDGEIWCWACDGLGQVFIGPGEDRASTVAMAAVRHMVLDETIPHSLQLAAERFIQEVADYHADDLIAQADA